MAKKAKKPAARVGGKKNQGWTANARRAANRKRPESKAAAGKAATKAAGAVETAKKLVKAKRKEKTADAPDASSPVNLGPVVLPSAADAVRVLGELADLNDQALNAKKALLEQQVRTKNAKAKYDELMEEVTDKLRIATHGSSAPLLDIVEREEDTRRMEAAGRAGGVVDDVQPFEPDPEPEPGPVEQAENEGSIGTGPRLVPAPETPNIEQDTPF